MWELPKGAATITTLATFNVTNGANPGFGVLADPGGNLFGVTAAGGTTGGQGLGVAWELPKGASSITVLAAFDATTGGIPTSAVLDAQGNLFGVTGGEGQSGHPYVVWEIATEPTPSPPSLLSPPTRGSPPARS